MALRSVYPHRRRCRFFFSSFWFFLLWTHFGINFDQCSFLEMSEYFAKGRERRKLQSSISLLVRISTKFHRSCWCLQRLGLYVNCVNEFSAHFEFRLWILQLFWRMTLKFHFRTKVFLVLPEQGLYAKQVKSVLETNVSQFINNLWYNEHASGPTKNWFEHSVTHKAPLIDSFSLSAHQIQCRL